MFSIFVAAARMIAKEITLQWDSLVVAFTGKQIAVLGARGAGKTHLIKFLTTGSIPAEYKQTLAPEKTIERRFQLKELDLRIKATLDVSGDKAAYDEWKELHDKADIVIYMFRADLLIKGDPILEARISDDMKHISDWLDARKDQPRFFLIGTHCDLDPEYSKINKDRLGDYVDNFRKLPIVSKIIAWAGGTKDVKLILGSMSTIEETEVLVYQTFAQVQI